MVIHESKYRASWSATSNPDTLLGYGYGYRQMDDGWIRVIAGKMEKSVPDLSEQIKTAANSADCEKTISVVTEDGLMFLYQWKDNMWKLVQ
jgi:hypothetical protein